MTQSIRLFIVDDHTLFREGLIRLLESEPRIKIVGSAGSVATAIEALERLEVDVLIADYDLGESTVLPLLQKLNQARRLPKTLLVTAGVPHPEALELVRQGVAGILHKHRPLGDLRHSVFDIAEGRLVLDAAYFQRLIETASTSTEKISLTPREKELLTLLLEGLANKQIAAKLGCSESLVKTTLQQLFAKTGVRTRSQLVRIAIEKLRDQL